MRHRMANRKLGRTSAHRGAMFRNQVATMIQNERIVTTLIKAKEAVGRPHDLLTVQHLKAVKAQTAGRPTG